MPEKTCPYCGEDFDANSLETESCRKSKCVKANQRKKKRGNSEVKRGRPKKSTSHVTELKKRVKERILGKAEGPSSTSGSKIPQGTDVPPWPGAEAMSGLIEKMSTSPKGLTDPLRDVPPSELKGVGTSIYPEGDVRHEFVPPSLAQNVLSRLTSKIQSSPTVIPKGTPIK